MTKFVLKSLAEILLAWYYQHFEKFRLLNNNRIKDS